MKTLKLTAKDFKESNYIGKEDVSEYAGHIEIEAGLGWVNVTETGLPDEKKESVATAKGETITLNGKKYREITE